MHLDKDISEKSNADKTKRFFGQLEIASRRSITLLKTNV